jgi:cytochrome c biogenesis factor
MWDPVENAGLIPWFTSTAFLHSVMIQERRGMLRRWNAVLVCVTFLLTIFGTFLTRSQLIVSIHAFADSTLADYFLGLMLFLVVVSAGLIAWRWRALRSEHNIESFWSRESFFVLNNVLLVSCAFIVLWGTLFPKISDLPGFRQGFNTLVLAFNGSLGIFLGPLDTLNQAVDLGEPWFNRVMAPLGLGLLFLTGAGPIIAWRRATKTNFRKNFAQPLLWAVIPALGTSLWVARQRVLSLQYQGTDVDSAWTTVFSELGATESYITLSFYFCFFSFISIMLEFYRGAAIRRKKFGGSHLWNWMVLTLKARRRFGGYIVHIGIILCFLAFTGNAFKEEVSEQVLHVGDYLERGEYRVTLARLDDSFEPDGRYVASQALLMVNERGDPINAAGQQALADTLEARGLTPARVTSRPGHANTQVQLQHEAAYQKLLAVGLASTLSRNFLRLPDATDEPARIYRFRDEPVLKIKPMAFMRYVRDLKTRFSEIPTLGAQADFTPGSTVLRIRFDSDEAMEAFTEVEALASALPEILNIRASDQPQTADLILASSGRILVPEVRFYEKHSTPTTEIAIESHLFEDLYLAMRPATGKPFISLYAVVAPLVSFLWLGTLLLLLGAFIAVLPDWAVAFVPSSPRRASPDRPAPRGPGALHASMPTSWIAVLACGALFSMVLGMEAARARQDTNGSTASNQEISPSPLAPITTRLSCPERVSGGWTVHESRSLADCPTAEGKYMRELVHHLHQSAGPFDLSRKRDRSQLLQALVREDPRADRLLKVPVREFTNIWHHTKCLCGCSHILFQCGMECGPGKDWKETMRQQFAAGFTQDEVLHGYMAFWNARLPPTAKPYNRESILKDPGQEGTWVLPMLGGCAVLFAFFFAIRRHRRDPEPEPDSTPGPPETLSDAEDSLIDDLLDESGGPMS